MIAASSDMAGVNELISPPDSFTQSIVNLMFLHLLEEQADFDQHPPTFAPQLAASWEWSEDHTELTLLLRPDVVWSDGVPVTAADVEWSWRAQIDPEVAWGLADVKENIAAVEAVNERTVRVTYHRRSVSQLNNLNEGVILPQHIWSQLPFSDWHQNGEWFVDNLVTNGPFQLDSWQRQQQVALRRNDTFFDRQLPYLDRVVFRVVPQKTNQVGQLLAGDVDFVDHIPPADGERVGASKGIQLLTYWPRQFDFVCWNTARPLFAEDEVRQALTMAIDRQELVEALWFGHARISASPIISSVWAHNHQIQPWPYDPTESRRILEARGWSDTDGDGVLDRGGVPFSFELITNTNSTVRVDAAVLIQEQLRRVGLDARVRRLEFNTLVAKSLEHDFDAILGGWTIPTTLDLAFAFHSDSIDNGYNFGVFSNSEVDRLIDSSRDQTDPAEKGETLRQIQELLHQQQPYTLLWEPQRLTGMAVQLQGAEPNALDPFFRLEHWWLLPTN